MPRFVLTYRAMKLSLNLKDDQYPFSGITEVRRVSRVIAFDSLGRIAIHTVSRDDAFGCQTYLETPGGGVDEGEDYQMAAIREAKEELGDEVQLLECLGECVDAYNLIKRKNENRFFLARIKKEGLPKHFVSQGDLYIKETRLLTPKEIEEGYAAMPEQGVSLLVKRRELPFLRLAFSRLPHYLGK